MTVPRPRLPWRAGAGATMEYTMSNAAATTTPVLIVGAGPVGLAMAIDLAYNGVPCTPVDQGDGTIAHPKIGTIMTRTMEFFRRWGVVDQIRQSGFPDDYHLNILFCTSLTGYLLDKDCYPSTADAPMPEGSPQKRQRCPQTWLNPVLLERAKALPEVTLLLQHEFDAFSQDENGVQATIKNGLTGETVSIAAEYLIGCDGAASLVREQLGFPMLGNPKLNYSIGILFRCPELLSATGIGELERVILVGENGTWGNLTVIDGKDYWRLTIFGSEERFKLEGFDAEKWIHQALGKTDIPFEVLSIVPWRRTELVAEHYRKGRVFLAGDSAHTMSPTGGMGVNTGFGDVWDLGWKIAAHRQGWGGETLLASYELERRPVAVRNASFSTHNFKHWQVPLDCSAIFTPGEEGDRVRRQIGETLKQGTRSDWQSWGIQLGYRYENSPVCVPDGTPAPPDDYINYVQTARPGHRAPHVWLDEGHARSSIDLFGREFVLMAFSQAGRDALENWRRAAAQRGLPLRVESMDDPAMAALYAAPLVLVRPDGHVAWRGQPGADAASIFDVVSGMTAAADSLVTQE